MRPKVTVIHTCYNHEQFAIESLESVKNQTFQDFEWIIIDDCSKDNSVSVIQKWIDDNAVSCQLITHQENKGFCATLNEALALAKGEYICYFSTDDVMLPKKLEVQVSALDASGPKVGVVYSNAYLIDENSQRLEKSCFDVYRKIDPPAEGDIFQILLEENFIPAPSTMIRKECYTKVGLYDERLTLEDWDMWIRIARHYHFSYSPYVSVEYRHHQENTFKKIENNRIEHLLNTFLSFERVLNRLTLSEEEKEVPRRLVNEIALHFYFIKAPNYLNYLRRAVISTKTTKLIKVFIFHSLCPNLFKPFVVRVVRLFRRIKWRRSSEKLQYELKK